MISRRQFIYTSAAAFASMPLALRATISSSQVMTVNGPIAPRDMMGQTLVHEHILVDFIGADKASSERYNADEVFNAALPLLKDVKTKGCNTFIDCTPAYLGRDVALLKRLAHATGLNIITNTGYYGAAGEKYLPRHAYTETAEQIAARWIREWTDGIDGTNIKPGFIKSGVDNAPLTPVQQKLIEAAAITHLATGLTIGVHTGNGNAAREQIAILTRQGVDASAWIWIHAQNEKDTQHHLDAARKGGWVSLDGINADNMDLYVRLLKVMKENKLLHRVLLSQDSGWYHVGEPNGGDFNGYSVLFTQFIPALKQNGFTSKDIRTLLVNNPADAFAIQVRKLKN